MTTLTIRSLPSCTGKLNDLFGICHDPDGLTLTIDEMNDIIARGWAGEFEGQSFDFVTATTPA